MSYPWKRVNIQKTETEENQQKSSPKSLSEDSRLVETNIVSRHALRKTIRERLGSDFLRWVKQKFDFHFSEITRPRGRESYSVWVWYK